MSWGPPIVNTYGMISGLGTTFENAFDKARKTADEQQAAQMYGNLLQPTQTGAPSLASGLLSAAQTQTQQALNQGTQGPGAGLNTAGKIPSFIQQAADATGVSPTYLTRTAQIESGMNPNAHNPSGADGLFQFIPSTAKQYGVNTRDPLSSSMGAARLASDNANVLRSALGRDPTDGELYLAHQQGAGGASKLLANPNAPAESIVGRAAVVQNGGRPGMTAGEFASLWTGKFGGGQPMTMPSGGAQTAAAQPFGYTPPIAMLPQAGGGDMVPVPPSRPQGVQVASADPNFVPQMPAGNSPSAGQFLVQQAQGRNPVSFPSSANAQPGSRVAPGTASDEEGDTTDAADTTGSTAPIKTAQNYQPGQVIFPGLPQSGQQGPLPQTNGLARLNDQQRGMLRQMLANPVTRAQAMQQIQQLSQPTKPEIKEVGGQLYQIDPVSGQAARVQGVDNIERYQDDAGNQILRDKGTNRATVLQPSQKGDKGDEFNTMADARAKRATALGMQPGSPEYTSFVATGKIPTGARALTPEQEADQRARAAQAQGLEPGTAEFRDYALTGKLPDRSQMKATEMKAYEDANKSHHLLERQVEDLKRARDLNDTIYSGDYLPGAAAALARNAPWLSPQSNDKTVAATTEYKNLVGGATLSQGKEMFPGRVTNYDEKLLQDLKANPNMTPGERKVILDHLINVQATLASEAKAKAMEIQSGTRYRKGEGRQPAQQPAAQPATPNVPAGAIEMLKANPALAPQFEQKYGPGSARGILGGG